MKIFHWTMLLCIITSWTTQPMGSDSKTPLEITHNVKKLGETALNEKLPQEVTRQKVLEGLVNNADLLEKTLKDRISEATAQEEQEIQKAIEALENIVKEAKGKVVKK